MSDKLNKLSEALESNIPTTKVKISDGREITIRSMIVGELKLLLLAMEGESKSGEWYDTLQEIVNKCIKDDVKAEDLPTGDLELIYINIHMLSKGKSIIPVKYICEEEIESDDDFEICGGEMKVKLDLKKAYLSEATIDNVIKVNDRVAIKLRRPVAKEQIYYDADTTEDMFNLSCRCIQSITIDDEELVAGQDFDYEKLASFFDYFDSDTFEKMADYINDTPLLTYPIAMQCPKCGKKHSIVLKGLADFFE